MRGLVYGAAVCAVSVGLAAGQGVSGAGDSGAGNSGAEDLGYSSSEAAGAVVGPTLRAGGMGAGGGQEVLRTSVRPFSAVGLQVKVGLAGFGFDVATPLARKVNLRAGASFFSYSPHLTENGIDITGTVDFRSVTTNVDFYPFGGSFRISPGVNLHNGNHAAALAMVPGGETFSLNGVDYTSSASDPVHGTAEMTFGYKVAPLLTVGFGNMIPHGNRHWSVPFEIGVQYLGDGPYVALALSGTACQPGVPAAVGCQKIQNDKTTQDNVIAEQQDLSNKLSTLKFYPIVSIGYSYKFGK